MDEVIAGIVAFGVIATAVLVCYPGARQMAKDLLKLGVLTALLLTFCIVFLWSVISMLVAPPSAFAWFATVFVLWHTFKPRT